MKRPSDRTGLAIALSLLALLLLDTMGLLIKHLTTHYHAAELSAYRNLFGLVPAIIALWLSPQWHAQGRKLRIRQWKLGLARGVMVTLAQLCYYYSLSQIAFATTTTIAYANALFMTALAIPILGERVGLIRWAAVITGFVGVVLVMGVGRTAVTWAVIAPLGSAFLYALAGVTSRAIDDTVPSPLINMYSVGAALFCATGLALGSSGFTPIESGFDALLIGAMGIVGGLGVLCLTVSYRMTEQSNLAPFSYFGIPMAFGLGWLVYDEAPLNDLFPGAILIACGGLLVIWRERRLRLKRSPS